MSRTKEICLHEGDTSFHIYPRTKDFIPNRFGMEGILHYRLRNNEGRAATWFYVVCHYPCGRVVELTSWRGYGGHWQRFRSSTPRRAIFHFSYIALVTTTTSARRKMVAEKVMGGRENENEKEEIRQGERCHLISKITPHTYIHVSKIQPTIHCHVMFSISHK